MLSINPNVLGHETGGSVLGEMYAIKKVLLPYKTIID